MTRRGRKRDRSTREVNEAGRDYMNAMAEELIALREAAASCLRYLDGEVIEGLRSGRHTREAAANIAQHQSRNLRMAIERTGGLTRDGYATRTLLIPTPTTNEPPSTRAEGGTNGR